MASLIDLAYVKKYFPQWDKYCLDSESVASDDVLQNEIDLAEDEYTEYVAVDSTTLTDVIKRHLLVFTKKHCFDLKHSDTEFEHRPPILKDYDNLVAKLQKFLAGQASLSGQATTGGSSFIINTKDRKFDEWFSPDVDDLTSSESQ